MSIQENSELLVLREILKLLKEKMIMQYPNGFYDILNIIIEDYVSHNDSDFLVQLINDMDADEIVAFVVNYGERRNQPLLFLHEGAEISVAGNFFREMVIYINENMDKCSWSGREIFQVLTQLCNAHLSEYFNKEKLLTLFRKQYEKKTAAADDTT